MKRDMNLVRKILLWGEEQQEFDFHSNPKFEGYTEEEIMDHIHIMEQAGLVNFGERAQTEAIFLRYITWSGYDFLDAVRSDEIWTRVTNLVQKYVGSVSSDVLLKIVKDYSMDKLSNYIHPN